MSTIRWSKKAKILSTWFVNAPFLIVVRGGKSVIRKSCVTIMCRNDELSSTMSKVGCLLKDSELLKYLV